LLRLVHISADSDVSLTHLPVSVTRGLRPGWPAFAAIAIVPLLLLCLWRSPYAAELRPAITLAMPWYELMRAWVPEGLLLAATAFFSHRAFAAQARPLGAALIAPALIYIATWLMVWACAAYLPGWLFLGPLSGTLKPALDVALVGGLAGTFLAFGMVFASGLFYTIAALGMMNIGAAITAWRLPHMLGLALHGADAPDPRGAIDPARRLGIAVLVGVLYWVWSLTLALSPAGFANRCADAAGTIFLIGLFAVIIERSPRIPRV
jgi:hypothetical protein